MGNPKSLNILLLEPFYSGSHKMWADGLKKYSTHNITLDALPGRHWKWRMHGAAITFAERHQKDIDKYDVVIVTDMCDVATLKGLLKIKVPVIVYYHENQIAYPWSPDDRDATIGRDRRYAWINLTSAMAGDRLWFNSTFNMTSFLNGLPKFLNAFPDQNRYDLDAVKAKCKVVPLGLELKDFTTSQTHDNDVPIILWNHRWEYDKRPEVFFKTLYRLQDEGINFQLMVLGTHTNKYPKVFDEAKERLDNKILHFGPVKTRMEYISLVQQCDFLPVTSIQDFFGISVVEAIAAGVVPILPDGLAFEEHIPKEEYPELYYQSDDQFLIKLNALISKRRKYDLDSYVIQYDWESMISKYDNLLIEIVGSDH